MLYEGYLLYPYRRSSAKNRVRFQFGVLAPPEWVAANIPPDDSVAGSVESAYQQTELLVEAGAGAHLHLKVRFLQLQAKRIEQAGAAVDSIEADGELHVSFDEAIPHEFDALIALDELDDEWRFEYEVGGGCAVRPLGADVQITRERWPVSCVVRVSRKRLATPFPLDRVRVRIENAGHLSPERSRDDALRQSMLAAHVLVAVAGGAFVSLLDPPEWAADQAAACRNVHTFPVLAGVQGDRDVLLSSPILLYDYAQVAPESPGDLHDATEIDEILSLRTLTLTDEEKREARATDPRAAAIIDRVDGMPPEVFERLHGAIRSVRQANETVLVNDVRVRPGSRVRLWPRARGTDVHDMFVRGRIATVHAIKTDVDGSTHIAVTLDDDPGADLHEWYGRYHYFAPEEVEPV